MEKELTEKLSTDVVEIIGVDREKKSNMTKGIIIGASAVAVTWAGIYLFKKLKNRKPKQKTAPEVDEVE